MDRYDIIIPLGGGRNKDGSLTELSKQRLDKAAELYKQNKSSKMFALGGYFSTYSFNAIRFDIPGAQVRKDYLIYRGVNPKDIILVSNGRDTMLEAFISRKFVEKLGYKKILLVTSDKHIRRSLFIFKRILGKKFKVVGEQVPCGDILNVDEENEYYKIVTKLLNSFPKKIPDQNLERWVSDNGDYYCQHKIIHDRYHPKGKESQAYAGVKL